MAGVLTLEALQAAHGDSLILHYGTRTEPRFIVIDGGPKGIFKASLAPRLKQIQAARGGGVLEIRMLMVSHIDEDHITGILDLTRMLRDLKDNQAQLPYEILTLWHNSFDDIASKVTSNLAGESSAARLFASTTPKTADAAAIIASVAQGRQLRLDADALGLNMNSGFDDFLMFAPNAGSLNIGAKLRFTVLGPRQAELDALNTKWDKEVKALLAKKKKKKKGTAGEAELTQDELRALAAEFVDKSIHNLSSVVVLAEFEGKRILLTGDARGDFVLTSLREAKLLDHGKLAVDIFKVPHHGSIRNAAAELFEVVVADHYVFSANGRDGNPDPPTFDLIFKARPKGKYHLWLTNPVARAVTHIKKKKPAGVTLHVRKAADLSVLIELGTPIAW
jgi:beta-lactamase superfamily II metal-dependent hydrolase